MTKGGYLIRDGGYLRCKVLHCAGRDSSDPDFIERRRRMESVRKNIECYFGCLKQQFKILKIPNLIHKKSNIDNMMFTIVAIQNMMLDYSWVQQETTSWSVQLKWENVNISGGAES